MIRIIGPYDNFKGSYINVTSSSKIWSKELSPFYLGPIELYSNFKSLNMENAWQYSKVYKCHLNDNGSLNINKYFKWALKGWNNKTAIRYPMNKGAKAEYSFFNGKKYDYISARKNIYIPLYAKSVVKTDAFKRLNEMYNKNNNLVLFDFDGYEISCLSIAQVINNEYRSMPHAFILKMLLEKNISVINNSLILNKKNK